MGVSLSELLVLLFLASIILWIVAFFDVLRSEFSGNNKLIWFLAVTFVPFLGAIGYFFMGRKQKVKRGKSDA